MAKRQAGDFTKVAISEAADALLNALRKADPSAHVGPGGLGVVVVDGQFDMLRVAAEFLTVWESGGHHTENHKKVG